MSDRPPFPLALPQSCGTLHFPASLLWFFAGYSVPDYGEAGTFFIMLTLQPSFRPFNERSGPFSPLFLSPTRYAHLRRERNEFGTSGVSVIPSKLPYTPTYRALSVESSIY